GVKVKHKLPNESGHALSTRASKDRRLGAPATVRCRCESHPLRDLVRARSTSLALRLKLMVAAVLNTPTQAFDPRRSGCNRPAPFPSVAWRPGRWQSTFEANAKPLRRQ